MQKANLSSLLLITLLLSFGSGHAEQLLSDAEKLARVYQLYESRTDQFSKVTGISPPEVMKLQAAGTPIIFVDTRTPEERVVSTLPGAISEQQYFDNFNQFQYYTAIAYCTIGYRSGLFAQDMLDQGRTILNLRGGILAWTLEGGSVFNSEGRTNRLHVYHDRWNYAPLGYQAISFPFWRLLF